MEGTANSIATAPALMTAEELLARSSELGRCELINGELRLMSPAGALHGDAGSRILVAIGSFVYEHRLGYVFNSDTGFILRRNPDTVRSPDVSFLSRSRAPEGGIPEGYLSEVPDLAVEVISPSDTFSEVTAKANDYIDAGVPLVWVVDPRTQRAFVFRRGQSLLTVASDGALSGEDILPGFILPLAKLFERR